MQPGFIYWASDGLSDVNPNFDLYYHFAPAGRVSPYLGGGAGLHFYGTMAPAIRAPTSASTCSAGS